jgi:pimeloyl-ACP methyl ester carboxylesterase
MICSALLALFVMMAVSLAGARAASQALGLHLAPCTQGTTKVPAECGSFGVYEDRAAQAGRIISLHVVVLKARHHTGRAVTLVAGGPGESATAFAPYVADGTFLKALSFLRDQFDILFVDNRGMGRSNPSNCDFAPLSDPSSYFRQLFPDELVSACRKRYAAIANPILYNTNNAVDDLDDVRSALGYPKLALFGGSYGTFFSLVYVRRHADHVESAVLEGVAPPHFQPIPGDPGGAQTALDGVIAKCKHDAICNKRFPAFAQHFEALARRFDRGSIPMMVKNPATKRMETVALSKEVFVDQLRHVLYDPQSAAYVPYIVERANAMDYEPRGRMIEVVAQGGLDPGAYLSYSCAEFMPFISASDLNAAAAHSFAGNLRVRAQKRACSIWNVRPASPSFNDAVRSDLPVLMVAGSDDPATPPRYGEQALKYLPQGEEVLVNGAGHATETPCTDRLEAEFVLAGSAKALDISQCSAALKLPPFATSMKGWPQL